MQQLSMSSIVPGEESYTQLCIANSVEVRSDEICADSILSTDDAVAVPSFDEPAVKHGGNLLLPTQPSAVDGITGSGHQRQSRSKKRKIHTDRSRKQKSSSASAPCDVVRSHHCKSQQLAIHHQSDAEADAANGLPLVNSVSHPDAPANSPVFPTRKNDVQKLSSQVWLLHECLFCLNTRMARGCSTDIMSCYS